ncbi:MAG: dihydrolipoyl dehydrogenase [Candidatus Hodarchaeales archaeon]
MTRLKKYGLVVIGTGSSMNIVNALMHQLNIFRAAVIDKDEPGGICLTRGCIPTKMLVYPAEVIRTIQTASKFGIKAEIKKIDFRGIMNWMQESINEDIDNIRTGLSQASNIDYYHDTATFIDHYTLKVGEKTIKGDLILLCTGSQPKIPRIKGLDSVNYHTSDTILNIKELPEELIIVGGGYIAAEYGHFFSAMGSKVTIIGRNKQFLPQEDHEISSLMEKEMKKYLKILTNHEVIKVKSEGTKKQVIAINRNTKKEVTFSGTDVLIAAGRESTSSFLNPEKGGIETDEKGWIITNEYLETSQPNVYAFGDANGKHLFKHVGNYESIVAYYNIIGQKQAVDYHAIPSAVFSHPEVASVGLTEKDAVGKYGEENILVGFYKYEDTAKGMAMKVNDYFVKVLIEKESNRIIGAHIIGPQASTLIQEIINLMYTPSQTFVPIVQGMHIHPALPEVVERAFGQLIPYKQYLQSKTQ